MPPRKNSSGALSTFIFNCQIPKGKNQITDAISNFMLKAASKRIIGQLCFCSLWGRKTPHGCKGRQDMCVDVQNIARKPKTTERQEELEDKAVWNYESFQGNLCYYVRSEMSFQHCHWFIVSTIHAFIQQTFTGNPLNARHCARQTGSIR